MATEETMLLHTPLCIYEFFVPGFDGSSDKTDDYVKWIAAPTINVAKAYAEDQGWIKYETTIVEDEDVGMWSAKELQDYGVDVILRVEKLP